MCQVRVYYTKNPLSIFLTAGFLVINHSALLRVFLSKAPRKSYDVRLKYGIITCESKTA